MPFGASLDCADLLGGNVYGSSERIFYSGSVDTPTCTLVQSGGNDYILRPSYSAAAIKRYDMDGTNDVSLTISGDAPSTWYCDLAWDEDNSYLLVKDSTTRIRRYTLSGTTLTNIASDITLSSGTTITAGRGMAWHEGTIWIIDAWNTYGIRCLRYESDGTAITGFIPLSGAQNQNGMSKLFLSRDGNVYFSPSVINNLNYLHGAFYPLNLT